MFMQYNQPIGILGGTFDPIHRGHLAIAEHVLTQFQLDHVEFIPSFKPPHRKPSIASAYDRLTMVRLAIQDYPKFIVNDMEIKQQTISYSVHTLQQLWQEKPYQPFCFIIGADAFYDIDQWREWEKLLTLTHFIVINRDNILLTQKKKIRKLLQLHQTTNKKDLQLSLAGKIYLESIPNIPISAENIRLRLKQGEKNIVELPKSVNEYIIRNNLYEVG